MRATDFIKMLYKRVAPQKPEPFTEKQVYVSQTKAHSPGLPILNYARTVSDVFNAYCTEMGVQVLTTMDPKDFKTLICFKVVGNRDVQIDYQKASYTLSPGEHIDIKIDGFTNPDELPRLTLLPHGNIEEIPGWSSYKVHQSSNLPTRPGVNRQFFQYESTANNDARQLIEGFTK